VRRPTVGMVELLSMRERVRSYTAMQMENRVRGGLASEWWHTGGRVVRRLTHQTSLSHGGAPNHAHEEREEVSEVITVREKTEDRGCVTVMAHTDLAASGDGAYRFGG
jgi:hypothetical protein